MNQHYLEIIDEALISVLNMMAGIELSAGQGQTHIKDHEEVLVGGSITSVISLNSDQLHLSVALTFPKELVEAIAQKMLPGMGVDADHPMASDLVGELANMVVGSAKNRLDSTGNQLSLSLPVVVSGSDYHVEHKTGKPVWVTSYSSDSSQIFVELSYNLEEI